MTHTVWVNSIGGRPSQVPFISRSLARQSKVGPVAKLTTQPPTGNSKTARLEKDVYWGIFTASGQCAQVYETRDQARASRIDGDRIVKLYSN